MATATNKISPQLKPLAVPLDGLNLDPANARQHDERGIGAVKASLGRFGQLKPIVVQKKGRIVRAGNATVVAARELGWTEIAANVKAMSDVEARAYGIADNRTAELASWDDEQLAAILADLQADDSIDESVTGFIDADLAEVLARVKGKAEIVEDEVPEPPEKPITKPGDLWLLGDHRVLCGDSTKGEDVGRVIDHQGIGAVVTDPPYGIGFEYASYDDARDKWFGLIDATVPQMRSLAPFVVMPCCGIDRMGWWYANHAPDWLIAWYKGSPGHRSYIGFNDWECLLAWGKPPKQMHDYFQTACGFNDAEGHPCPKPVAWGAWLCERAVESGGIIFDPFLGSGTTLIAAEQLGRRCYGIEIEPRYVDVIVKRWEKLTGKRAKLEGSGKRFPR